jgi:Uma2 family endonuclease
LLHQQHLLMTNVSWDFYESLLAQIGDRPLRVTYSRGDMEIMAPLLEHEVAKSAIGQLLEMLAVELDIPFDGFGSTTFKDAEAEAGLEPDECYYSQNAPRVRGMKRFDPAIDPPPDPIAEFTQFVRRIPVEGHTAVLREFRNWVRTLPTG